MYDDPVQWFDEYPKCRCGELAAGRLMGPRNESYGSFCMSCAMKRLRKADVERAKKSRERAVR